MRLFVSRAYNALCICALSLLSAREQLFIDRRYISNSFLLLLLTA